MFHLPTSPMSERKDPLVRIPFLDGSTKATHPMTEAEVLEIFKHSSKWLKDFQRVGKSFSEKLDETFGEFEVRCIHCRSPIMSQIDTVLDHILQRSHVKVAYNLGLMFCKENDLIPYLTYSLEAQNRLRVDCPSVNLDNLEEIIERFILPEPELPGSSGDSRKSEEEVDSIPVVQIEEKTGPSKKKKRWKTQKEKNIPPQKTEIEELSSNSAIPLRFDFTYTEISRATEEPPPIPAIPIAQEDDSLENTSAISEPNYSNPSASISFTIERKPPFELDTENLEFLSDSQKYSDAVPFSFEFDEQTERPIIRTEISSSGSYASTVKGRVISPSKEVEKEDQKKEEDSKMEEISDFQKELTPPPSTSTTTDNISSPEISDEEWLPPPVPLPVAEGSSVHFLPEVRQPPLAFIPNLSSFEIQSSSRQNYESIRPKERREETEIPIKTEEPKAVTMMYEGQRKFEKLDSNAYEEQEEQGISVYFNARVREDEAEDTDQSGPSRGRADSSNEIGFEAINYLRIYDAQLQLQMENSLTNGPATEGCRLSHYAALIPYMNVSCDTGSLLLSEENLTSNAQEALRLIGSAACFKSQYYGIKQICLKTCYLCGFISKCCCDYVFHLFGQEHIAALKQKGVKVSLKAFQFWFAHLQELREQTSLQELKERPLPLFALLPNDDRRPFIQTVDRAVAQSLPYLPERLVRPPISCTISSNERVLCFLNTESLSLRKKLNREEQNELFLEPNYLLKLGEAISVHYNPSCYNPKNACPYIRFFCPSVCPVCHFKASCVCLYIRHLFGARHLRQLIKNRVGVSLSDLRFWLNHLTSFSGHQPNYQMRPILEPLSNNSDFYISSFDYPHFVLSSNHVYSVARESSNLFENLNESCKIQ